MHIKDTRPGACQEQRVLNGVSPALKKRGTIFRHDQRPNILRAIGRAGGGGEHQSDSKILGAHHVASYPEFTGLP